MVTLKKFVAVLLLLIGIPLSILTIAELLDATAEDREGTLAALILFGLPPAAVGTGLLYSVRRQTHQAERDRLRAIFFQLLETGNGKINVLHFVRETNLSPEAAKAYLDSQAQEFNGDFDVSEEGTIYYHFNL